jgi:hypothetical protein
MAPPVGCVQEGDGLNANVAGWGGSFAHKDIYGGTGSVAMPLGCKFDAELDAAAASFDRKSRQPLPQAISAALRH